MKMQVDGGVRCHVLILVHALVPGLNIGGSVEKGGDLATTRYASGGLRTLRLKAQHQGECGPPEELQPSVKVHIHSGPEMVAGRQLLVLHGLCMKCEGVVVCLEEDTEFLSTHWTNMGKTLPDFHNYFLPKSEH